MSRFIKITLNFFLLAVGQLAVAEVVSKRPGYFVIEVSREVNLQPAEAYQRFIAVTDWWNPAHTWSGVSKHLVIDRQCFCEIWENSYVKHLETLQLLPGKLIRFSGGLGPLQESAMEGLMDIKFQSQEGGSRVSLSYQVWASQESKVELMASAVDSVLREQLARYQSHLSSR